MVGRLPERRIDLKARLERGGPRKLLAIDGGGIRGVLSLKILEEIERSLIKASNRADYRLADYFDYVAGTSTGGIIAAGISIGMPVKKILDFYLNNGAAMFDKASIIRRLQYQYKREPLALKLKEVFGEDTTLGAPELETLLLLVMRNATTDSPWAISNNPFAKYNDTRHEACNLRFPLWQLVRASTAAPTYFPPEVIDCCGKPFVFVDGGITMYNNPAFQMFLMATVDRYWVHAPVKSRGWKTGVDDMLIVSIGTGTSAGENYSLRPDEMNLIFNATAIPSALMYAALNEQDALCRIFGDCVAGPLLDRELDNLIPSSGPLDKKLFRYVRYNAELTQEGLAALGCGNIEPTRVQKLDSIEALDDLQRIGGAVAEQRLNLENFNLNVFRP
ncbi:patatin-like phospholipase family protein [Bradyrhizobium sp. Arg816]|uniref:patatin-like phospholipase family protein n=1 Tax=Bradyrhizobium sp. Arg816 TaxID=2998491 RepID=UPI00249EC6D2|nr:patatin-like phospholipase family protein [Bradyrhizobium sp. Arg816]MDI3561150.1 patatin-like phospholipase family protein [Bradyrhizobium sp. Arg816]